MCLTFCLTSWHQWLPLKAIISFKLMAMCRISSHKSIRQVSGSYKFNSLLFCMLNYYFLEDKRSKTVEISLLNGTQRGLGWGHFSDSSPNNKFVSCGATFNSIWSYLFNVFSTFYSRLLVLFRKKIGGHQSFCGATDTPALDFWWCLLWVQSQDAFPRVHALLHLGNRFLRFTFGVTLADFWWSAW